MKLYLVFFAAVFSLGAFASQSPLAQLQAQLESYQKAKMIELSGQRKTTSTLTDMVLEFDTKLFVNQAGLFRMESSRIEGKVTEKTLSVFDGRHLWLEARELGKPKSLQVSRMRLSPQARKQMLVSVLFTKDIAKAVRVTEAKSDGKGTTVFALALTDRDLQISDIQLTIKDRLLKSLSYFDEVGNKTEFKFEKSVFRTRLNPQLFKYQAPPGVRVTEL